MFSFIFGKFEENVRMSNQGAKKESFGRIFKIESFLFGWAIPLNAMLFKAFKNCVCTNKKAIQRNV